MATFRQITYLFFLALILSSCTCSVKNTSAIVNPEAVHRFDDKLWFGTRYGLWRAHVGISNNAIPICGDFGKVTGLETSKSKLLISSVRGLFCLNPDSSCIKRITPQISMDGFFRKGGTKWATTRDFDLYALDLTSDDCKTISATQVDLDGRMYFESEREENILWMTACYPKSDKIDLRKQCGLFSSNIPNYALETGSYYPPKLVAEFPFVNHMITAAGSLWLGTQDGVFHISKDTSDNLKYLEGFNIWQLFKSGDELWATSPKEYWRWSNGKSDFEKIGSSGELYQIITKDGFSWATLSNGGLYRWKTNSGEHPQLLHDDIKFIEDVVRWNGCDWVGTDKGLFRSCSGENWRLDRVSPEITSINRVRLAGWEKGVVTNARPNTSPDFLWVASDTGVVRFSATDFDKPKMMNDLAIDADLIIAGDYLWLLSYEKIARWKLDSSSDIETYPHGQISKFSTKKMCTDITSLWIITSKGLIRVPDVRSPDFRLDYDEIHKAQYESNINDVLRYEDTRYWNCQEVHHKSPIDFGELHEDFLSTFDIDEDDDK